MRLSILFFAILFVTCTKENKMSDQPLKAIAMATVNGKVITLKADQSTGDVCAYGFAMKIGSPAGANCTFSPNSSVQGEKNPRRNESGQPYYVSGSLKYIPITATVDKVGTYVFTLQVLDKNNIEDWDEINVEVK